MRKNLRVRAPANIALIKHWGLLNGEPVRKSLSFNLSACFHTFTISAAAHDSYIFDGGNQFTHVALTHISRVRLILKSLGVGLPFVEVKCTSSFPAGIGLASSAAFFSGITFGLLEMAFDGDYEFRHLVHAVKLGGSMSALRSLRNFYTIYDPVNPNDVGELKPMIQLVDIACVISSMHKHHSSQSGHQTAHLSPFFTASISNSKVRFESLIAAFNESNCVEIFRIIEDECWSFLNVCYSADVTCGYVTCESLAIITMLKKSGVNFSYTFDAGSTVHIICCADDAEYIISIVGSMCISFFVNTPCKGVCLE